MDYQLRWYGLRGTEVVLLDSVDEWGKMMRGKDRIVKQEYVGNVFVSTVFLGLDHSFTLPGEPNHIPLFFETMVFGGKLDQEMERYPTWQSSLAGHGAMVDRVRASMTPIQFALSLSSRALSLAFQRFLSITRLAPIWRTLLAWRRRVYLRSLLRKSSSFLQKRMSGWASRDRRK